MFGAIFFGDMSFYFSFSPWPCLHKLMNILRLIIFALRANIHAKLVYEYKVRHPSSGHVACRLRKMQLDMHISCQR